MTHESSTSGITPLALHVKVVCSFLIRLEKRDFVSSVRPLPSLSLLQPLGLLLERDEREDAPRFQDIAEGRAKSTWSISRDSLWCPRICMHDTLRSSPTLHTIGSWHAEVMPDVRSSVQIQPRTDWPDSTKHLVLPMSLPDKGATCEPESDSYF